MTVSIRLAGPGDAAGVAALEREALGRDAWSENLVTEAVAGRIPTTLCLVATDEPDQPIGYAAVSVVADLAELQRIAVAAPHRRTGVASALLSHVEREAAARHADRVLLEVRDDNAGALAFYARLGFTELSRRERYYADGTTAIVLVRDIGRMDL
ncbi:MAG TPA: ribosomal protein S18-alanine N-acetyltransferase [Nocardioides sp.]|nr:ribosomal protein S18-alanine N-acetyltransferase [Nocardioides sp.]